MLFTALATEQVQNRFEAAEQAEAERREIEKKEMDDRQQQLARALLDRY